MALINAYQIRSWELSDRKIECYNSFSSSRINLKITYYRHQSEWIKGIMVAWLGQEELTLLTYKDRRELAKQFETERELLISHLTEIYYLFPKVPKNTLAEIDKLLITFGPVPINYAKMLSDVETMLEKEVGTFKFESFDPSGLMQKYPEILESQLAPEIDHFMDLSREVCHQMAQDLM